MHPANVNAGVYAAGPGNVTVHGGAIGQQINQRPASETLRSDDEAAQRGRVDVGILTVLDVETRAVVEMLRRHGGYRTDQIHGGAQVHRASFPTEGGPLSVVAMQTLDRGPRSAVIAYERLRRRFAPRIVLLVGVAGGITDKVDIGDVVLSDRIIYYDARRVSAEGEHRRGDGQSTAAVVRHRIQAFQQSQGNPIVTVDGSHIRFHFGPVGSGDAVVTDAGSDIRTYLLTVNEKTLAVETEACGVAQAFHEEVSDEALRGWLTVRGISDAADRSKGHGFHELASRNAAAVVEVLLGFLKLVDR